MLDLGDVQSFVSVAEAGGISAAARALDLPKSSVSRSVTRLEGVLGVVLCERSARSLRLTEAGSAFLPHAKRVLFEADEAAGVIGRFSEVPRGLLRIKATYSITEKLITPMLPAFLKKYPEVNVALNVENRRTDTVADEADLVIKPGPVAAAGAGARKLSSPELWTCASPAYLRKKGTPHKVEDLRQHDLIGVREQARWTFTNAKGSGQTFDFTPRAIVPEPATAHVLIADGVGIGRLPDYIASRAVASRELVRLFETLASERVDIYAVASNPRHIPARARAFIDELGRYLGTA